MAGLRPKQALFVEEYLVDLNASAAARRAGYSVRTADAIGLENLGKPGIAQAIAKRMAERAEKVGLTAQEVICNVMRIGLKAEAAEEFGPALKAQELLGKHLGTWIERLELTGANGGPVQLSW